MLAALGVEAIDVLDELVTPEASDAEPAATDLDARRRQVEAFVAAAGGA